jgi:O-antigen ligase
VERSEKALGQTKLTKALFGDSFAEALTRGGLLVAAVSFPFSHVPVQLGFGVAALGWILQGVVYKDWQVRWHPFFVAYLAYLVWNFVAGALSDRPGHSLWAVVDNEWPVLAMLVLFWSKKDETWLKTLVSVLIISSSVAMVYAIIQTFTGVEWLRGVEIYPAGSFHRSIGFFSHHLTFAAFAMAVFFLSASFALNRIGSLKWTVTLTVLAFAGVVVTFARGMWVVLALGIPVLGFLTNRKLGIAITALLIIVVVAGLVFVPEVSKRAESIMDLQGNENRLNLWTSAWNMFLDHPVFGVGQDNWDLHFPKYRVEGWYDTIAHPHNDYLNVLTASGIPGLLAFVSMWVIALRSGYRAWKRTSSIVIRAVSLGALLSLGGMMMGGLIQDYYGTFVNCFEWWFLAGLLFAAVDAVESPQAIERTETLRVRQSQGAG